MADDIKLTCPPIADTKHVLGIPAIEGVDNPGLTLVHPGEDVGSGQTYENPIHSPDIRDAILVFPVAGIAPLYVALSVRPGDHRYHVAPLDLVGFPDTFQVDAKSSVQGGGKKRSRWKDKRGRIYEWDSQHGKVEMYDKQGHHLGEFDADTGEQTKPAKPNRSTPK